MGETIVTAITSSFQTVATDTIAVFTAVIPIGLSIFTVMWAVKKAKKFFSGVGG